MLGLNQRPLPCEGENALFSINGLAVNPLIFNNYEH